MTATIYVRKSSDNSDRDGWTNASRTAKRAARGERCARRSMMLPTFGLPGSVVWDMEMHGVSLPTGVHPPDDLGATVMISCTDEQARAMETWLRNWADTSNDPAMYLNCAHVINRVLRLSK
jgi:hypothetical protein